MPASVHDFEPANDVPKTPTFTDGLVVSWLLPKTRSTALLMVVSVLMSNLMYVSRLKPVVDFFTCSAGSVPKLLFADDPSRTYAAVLVLIVVVPPATTGVKRKKSKLPTALLLAAAVSMATRITCVPPGMVMRLVTF